MKYMIYKTTNNVNGKYYVGAHATTNLKDSYMGSGTALKSAFKEYGRANFTMSVVEYCNSAIEMYERESEIVNEEFVSNRQTYNIKLGGKGGLGSKKSATHKQNISNAIKAKYASGHYDDKKGNFGRKVMMLSDEIIAIVENSINFRDAATKLNITMDAVKGRYHRAKRKLKGV